MLYLIINIFVSFSYFYKVPVQCGTELVAINLKNNVAILFSDSSMCEMRRQVSHDVPKTVKSPKQTDLSELLSIGMYVKLCLCTRTSPNQILVHCVFILAMPTFPC